MTLHSLAYSQETLIDITINIYLVDDMKLSNSTVVACIYASIEL